MSSEEKTFKENTISETDNQWAQEQFKEMLKAVDLESKGSYSPEEVCSLLGISYFAFKQLTRKTKLNAKKALPENCRLSSFSLVKQRRVPHGELISFLARNRTDY